MQEQLRKHREEKIYHRVQLFQTGKHSRRPWKENSVDQIMTRQTGRWERIKHPETVSRTYGNQCTVKIEFQITRAKTNFLMVLGQQVTIWEKIKLDPQLTHYARISSKGIRFKREISEPLDVNMGEFSLTFGSRKAFQL